MVLLLLPELADMAEDDEAVETVDPLLLCRVDCPSDEESAVTAEES